MGTGMNFHFSFSTYHMRLCSVIRELGKHSHFYFTLARPSPEHVIFTSLMCTVTDWHAIIVNDFVWLFWRKSFFFVHCYKSFWNSSCFSGNGDVRESGLLFGNKWELEYSLKISQGWEWECERRHGNGREWVHKSHSHTSLLQMSAMLDWCHSSSITNTRYYLISRRIRVHLDWWLESCRSRWCGG